MIYHRFQDEIFESKKKRRISDITIQNLNNSSCNLLYQSKNKKKIIKLKNEKIEDYFIIKNFLPICEEFLLKNYKNNFLQAFNEREKIKDVKTKNKEIDDVTDKNEESNYYEKEVSMIVNENSNITSYGGNNLDEKKKLDKNYEKHDRQEVKNKIKLEEKKKNNHNTNLEKDISLSNKIFNKKNNSTNSFNLYENYVRITKKSLKEMDLPFDRAVLLNAIDRRDNCEKIIKIINKKKVLSAFGESWEEMIEYIISLKEHKNLMKIFDIYDDEKNFYIIMEKLYGKELFSFLVYKKQVKESICKYIISQILQAANYLHFNNVIHRDIKPENLMFRNKKRKDRSYEYNYELVLIDYDTCHFINNNHYPNNNRENKYLYSTVNGIISNCIFSPTKNLTNDCAKLYKQDEEDKNVKQFYAKEFNKTKKGENYSEKAYKIVGDRTSIKINEQLNEKIDEKLNKKIDKAICNKNSKTSINRKHIKLVGTYGYIAPEIIKGYGYSILSDMWSIGIIFYILMTGITPLPMCLMINYKNTKEILLKKEKKGINFNLLSFNNYPLAKDLCEKFLQFDPNKRIPNSNIASNHPWLKYFNILKKNFTNFSYEDENNNPHFCINKIIKYNFNGITNNIKNINELKIPNEIDNHVIYPYNKEYCSEYYKEYHNKDSVNVCNSYYNNMHYYIQKKKYNNVYNNLTHCAPFNNNIVLFNQEYIYKNNEHLHKGSNFANYLFYINKFKEDNDIMNNSLCISNKNKNIDIVNGIFHHEDNLYNSINDAAIKKYIEEEKEETKMKDGEGEPIEGCIQMNSMTNVAGNNYNKFIELFESLIEKKKNSILSSSSKFNELILHNNTIQSTDDILNKREFYACAKKSEKYKKNSKKKEKLLNEENNMIEMRKEQNIQTYENCEVRKNNFLSKNEYTVNDVIFDNENEIYCTNHEINLQCTPLKGKKNFYTKNDMQNNIYKLIDNDNHNNYSRNATKNINETYENTNIYEMHNNINYGDNDNYLNTNNNIQYSFHINNSINNNIIGNKQNNNMIMMGVNYNSNKNTLNNNISEFSCINNGYNCLKFYSNSISNRNNLIYENLITNTESCDSFVNQKNQNIYFYNSNCAHINTSNYYITNKFEKTLNPYVNEYYNINDIANSAFQLSNEFNEYEIGAKKKKRKKISAY
ncbi:calcium/calmodulin-dependent protein kinase, putative [Plasmodium relictum]|uniref:Calcium/calmodulin-dependent protein kinase, putative n=1 Tax=Plasmodium relictum TaxID=85471 RepID=A0A1J1H8K4_PLARL|nr:calcium/calmodulin-dependent protein kinase, putative [Plasmodium relictum]CRG99925.1 calcium/calmodulin-dependent protein kinase, putative [Plasmodium relictum]